MHPWPLCFTASALLLAACMAAPGHDELAVPPAASTPTPALDDAGERPPEPPPANSAAPNETTPASSASADEVAVVPPEPKIELPHEGPLATFHDALRDLQRGRRQDHVRIMWLGDSHAQADFWTGAVRSALQQRFGNAGPGFVHLGFKQYRHNGLRLEVEGKWRMRPKAPSTPVRWGDGAFGLGGILHAGFADTRYATMQLTDSGLTGRKLSLDFCYKYGLPYDKFRLTIGDQPRESFAAKGKGDTGKIRHIQRDARGLFRLKVQPYEGRPDFCGVVIETSREEPPGVVLDNLGINGARYGTALAWNEAAWAREVKRRVPELFILEFGGNEASDWPIRPAKYKRQTHALIARVRRIRPDVSCLVIGPADRADAEAKIPPIVNAMKDAATEAGCRFWNTYEKMGGKGSLRKWRDEQRAAEDGVHLKPKAYLDLGAWLYADLMDGYQG